jgi:hypothetical protein
VLIGVSLLFFWCLVLGTARLGIVIVIGSESESGRVRVRAKGLG